MLGSFKGPRIRLVAGILGLAALIFGIWVTFFQSAGFVKTSAKIVSIEKDPDYVPDPNSENDERLIATVKYHVDGIDYFKPLDTYSATYKVGSEVEVLYDPKNPGTIHSSSSFGIIFMVVGGVILASVIILTVRKNSAVKVLKDTRGEVNYAPSEKGEERQLYFLTDTGTPKYGHRIEDKNRKVLYEAKMTKFTMTSPFGYDFIDRVNGTTTPHLIGHEEESDWNSLLIDNHYTFSFDGEDIWKHLKRNGITADSKLAHDKTLAVAHTIYRNGEELAYIETSSQYVHEEDAEQHKAASKIPVAGFYRIRTREKNLDLLFVCILAFARSGALDDKGGRMGMLFNRK